MTTTLVVEQHVPAEINRVWAAWTTAEGMAAWWWPQLSDTTYTIDVRAGGAYRIESAGAGIGVRGTYLSVEEPNELLISWIWLADDEPQAEERVRIQFTATHDNGTLVTITHQVVDGPSSVENYRQGWENVLARLAAIPLSRPNS
jgi:uncharacterized protein YndB with AHSA1/START domain